MAALNMAHGLELSNKVHDMLGVTVCPHTSSKAGEFLLASFSRCKFRLTEDWVDFGLNVALGGNPSTFRPFQLDDHVFRFSVSCKKVGFLVLKLKNFSCSDFKLGFFIYNDAGFRDAITFILLDSEPVYDWVQVKSRKNKSSYADVVKQPHNPLLGANSVPLGTNRQMGHGNDCHTNARSTHHQFPVNNGKSSSKSSHRTSAFQRISRVNQSVFDCLQFLQMLVLISLISPKIQGLPEGLILRLVEFMASIPRATPN